LTSLRIVVAAEHASARFGGEAILPLHYFRLLLARGIDVRLVVHERTRDELVALFPDATSRIHFLKDTWLHRFLWHVGKVLPRRLTETTLGVAMRLFTQREARRVIAALVRQGAVDVVHQPIPVSPKEPSTLGDLGVPLVIGPMNGGMSYPPAFRKLESRVQRAVIALLRRFASVAHLVFRGKRQATTLLIANERTARALPPRCRGRVVTLAENGVDFATFRLASARGPRAASDPLRIVFVGRLIELKALDVVIDAIARTLPIAPVSLEVVGDGPMRARWEQRASELGVARVVRFRGFLPQTEIPAVLDQSDMLVLPSIHECGGAVVLEAMAMGVVVAATAWGGPLDYLDPSCGFLVDPSSREAMVDGFASAMLRAAREPDAVAAMAQRALARCRGEFDWQAKIDRMLAIYADAVDRFRARAAADAGRA
jgi:glycosyltransferase involved in cell wall biosynthesis